ncbi:MAG: protein phosphatase 2C domain-containing protein [Desulfobacterales bacterium]|nr:protein phosphatase 2C domain-containing protein [Desulfobacterales bacterium]
MASIDAAGTTDVGRKRKGNEDSFLLDDDLGFYVVADGMGGHAAGEVASRIVVDTMRDFLRRFAADPSGAEQLPVADARLSKASNLLLNAVHLANQAVHHQAQKKISYQGMGSTVSAVLLSGDRLTAVNVGDSPIYLVRGDAIEEVSTPHTMMAEYKEMAPEAARNVGGHLRHVLTRAMGLKDRIEPAVREIRLSGGERVIICSDGLSDKATPEEILAVAAQDLPERAVDSLVAMANDRGGDDNITVIVARIGVLNPGRSSGDPPGETSAGSLQGRRSIAVDYDTETASHRTYVSEIREEGVFLQTKEAVAAGEEIWLTFTRPTGGDSIMVGGRVASRSSSGIEVRFENLSPDQRRWIASLPEDDI